MPEWYIQRIVKFPKYTNVSSASGRYYVEPFPETWDLFKMDDKSVKCKIARLLNFEGKIAMTFGEEAILDSKEVRYSYSNSSYYEYAGKTNAMMIPDEFVKNYGIREGDYLDFTLLTVLDKYDQKIQEVFPRRMVNGTILIQPSGDRAIPQARTTDMLIEQSIKEEFFVKLIQEINDSYGYELYRSTHVLLRTLFENLVFKLLKKRFPNESNLYMGKRGALDFSRLIDNLKEKKHEFAPHAKSFDEDFFTFLDEFREKANTSTHILEIYLDRDKIDKDKNKMNQYIKILDYVINEIGHNN